MAMLKSELMSLFTIPFEPKKMFYSLNSDFFQCGNASCHFGEKQLAIEIDDEELLHNPLPEFPCGEHGCKARFTTVHNFEIHYRIAHVIVCTECKKSFPSYNLLDLHIQQRHDPYFDIVKAKNKALDCIVDGCDVKFANLNMRNEHVIKVHNYPPNFKFQHLKLPKEKEMEEMDVTPSEGQDSVTLNKPRKTLPKNICFGRGSTRAFMKRKKPKSTSTDISMKELADAL